MAKRVEKETSLPLIISLVFFVLTTIGLGVFCYVLYSEQEGKDKAVAEAAKKAADDRKVINELVLVARAHRVFSGVEDADDRTALQNEVKQGDKAFLEIEKLNTAAKNRADKARKEGVDRIVALLEKGGKVDKAAVEEALAFPTDFDVWKAEIDPATRQLAMPKTTMLDIATRSALERSLALRSAQEDRNAYKGALAAMAEAAKAYKDAREKFAKAGEDLPEDFKKKMAALEKETEKRTEAYTTSATAIRKTIDELNDEKDKLTLEIKRLKEQVGNLKTDLSRHVEVNEKKVDPFQFDEPKGKILRRLADNVVEIDLGTAANVRQGLTFTVLPIDFPEKGRQSRMRVVRVPDDRGNYKNVEVFVPKGTIEVIEVIGPNLSRARITDEPADIRDRILNGDLLYNAVWRKGEADHVALVGIFDVNGDGTDDIEAVRRDLNKMGIVVDAVFDLQKGKWDKELQQRTRYVIEGHYPTPTPSDPNREAKTRLVSSLSNAITDAKQKGKTVVNFRDMFPRMGYKVKVDVSEDKINQAAARYLGTFVAPTDPAKPGM